MVEKKLEKRLKELEHYQSLLMGKDIGMSSVWSRFVEMEEKLNKAIRFWSNYGDMADLIRNNNAKQIAELKKKLPKVLWDFMAMNNLAKDYENTKEVLREGYIHSIGWIEKAFKIDNKMNLYTNDQKWHLVDSHMHAKKQLEKLDSPTSEDPYYPCGKEKTEKKEKLPELKDLKHEKCPICGNWKLKEKTKPEI